MALLTVQLPVFLSFMTYNYGLLLEDNKIPGHTTTLGPLGKDGTLSLLEQEVLDLKTCVKSQEREIKMMKTQQVSKDNVINTTVSKVDSMAKSIRYLTLSLQSHEIQNKDTNMTVYKELYHMDSKLIDLRNVTNATHEIFMSDLKSMEKRIDNLTLCETFDIQGLKIEIASQLKAIRSELHAIQTKVQQVYGTLKPNGNYVFMLFVRRQYINSHAEKVFLVKDF